MDPPTNANDVPISEIDTIFEGLYVGDEIKNS